MAVKVNYIDNVFLRTKNYQEMINFYRRTFDFPVAYRNDCVERLQVGDLADRAMITLIDDNHVVGDRLSLLGFHVSNIEETFKEVGRLKMHCDTHIRTFGEKNEFRYFNVVDPDGNIISLIEPV
ncbi:VOC family protein [Xylanibacillus composti]|uniref:VOC domain-containing protein n=1 Tax=Xylanibacillus composti TaxID=1572762 RepID=A0A8J4H1R8_9BACL|nr:VOC family protein [Xylanibacillus composti]MDT9726706.1 VOC family protein [Xylanibacillus composti]GIQ69362.1 hypothetical protein XYCOK13_21860 [Xylanibacillus composti]